jgi:small GTP-binding protein
MAEKKQKELLYKILLLGDSSVGKTCFLMRYSDNTFQEIHMSTIGLDYKLKNVQLDDGNIVKIQIWDTAGQDRFRSITKNYYKGAHGIILIYDITSRKTYENIKNWVTQIKEEVSDKVNIILVGNKIDDEKNRKVSTEEGEKMAKEIGFDFYETSAKTGINIDSTFNDLVKKTVESFSKTNVKGDKLNTKKAGSKRGCC